MDTGDDTAAIAAAVGASRPDEDVPMAAGGAAPTAGAEAAKPVDAPKPEGTTGADLPRVSPPQGAVFRQSRSCSKWLIPLV